MLAYCHDAGGSLLSSSPRTVISLFLSVVDDVDNARGRRTAHGERTKAARRRTTARPRTEQTGAVEDASVQSQVEGSTRVDWFGCGCVLGLTSPENNRTCGGIEGGTGQRWRVRTIGRRRRSQPWEAGAGGADQVGLVRVAGGRRRQEIEDTRQMLDVNPTTGRQNRLLTG